MTKPTTIGIDLAKHVYQVASLNQHHKLTFNASMKFQTPMNMNLKSQFNNIP